MSKRIGRPPIPAAERANVIIALRLTLDEFKSLTAAAGKLTAAEYIRLKLGLRDK